MQLPDLKDSEDIGRSVFSSGAAKRAKRHGRIIPEVFLEGREADSISVDRTDHAPPSVLAALSTQTGQNRTPPRNFYGWATLTVNDAAANRRTVEATPTDANIYHADIVLHLSDDNERRDQQKQHANELAALAQWREAP